MKTTHIIIADDHPIIHKGIKFSFKNIDSNIELYSAYDGQELLYLLSNSNIKYDILLLDIVLPGFQSIEDAELIINKYPGMKVVIFSQMPKELYALRYYKIGAFGYVEKSMNSDELMNAIQIIINGKKYFNIDLLDYFISNSDKNEQNLKDTNPFKILSNRELEVARCFKKGLNYKQIKDELNISISTISTYRARIYSKLQITSLSDFFSLLHEFAI